MEAITHSAHFPAAGKAHVSLDGVGTSPDVPLGAFSDDFLKAGAGLAPAQASFAAPAAATGAAMPVSDRPASSGQSGETAGGHPETGKCNIIGDGALMLSQPRDEGSRIVSDDKMTPGRIGDDTSQEDQDGLAAFPVALSQLDAARSTDGHETRRSSMAEPQGQPRPSVAGSIHVQQPVASAQEGSFGDFGENSMAPSRNHSPENAGSFSAGPEATSAQRHDSKCANQTNGAWLIPDSRFALKESGDPVNSNTLASGHASLQPDTTPRRSGTVLHQTVPAAALKGADGFAATEPTLTDRLAEASPEEFTATDIRGSQMISSQRGGPVFVIARYPHGLNEDMARAARILVAEGATEISLNPRDLGRVNMVLSGPEHALSVVLTVERPETLELVRRHLESLQKELESLGYADVTYTLTSDRDPDRDARGQTQSENPAFGSIQFCRDDDAVQSDAAHNLRRRITGIDIRL